MMVGRYKSNLARARFVIELTQWLAGQKRDVKERWEKVHRP